MTYTLSQVTEHIGTITLDHERRRNALSHALVDEVIAALRSFQEAKVRVGGCGSRARFPKTGPNHQRTWKAMS